MPEIDTEPDGPLWLQISKASASFVLGTHLYDSSNDSAPTVRLQPNAISCPVSRSFTVLPIEYDPDMGTAASDS